MNSHAFQSQYPSRHTPPIAVVSFVYPVETPDGVVSVSTWAIGATPADAVAVFRRLHPKLKPGDFAIKVLTERKGRPVYDQP